MLDNPRSVIDHTAFPDILDAVFEVAPRESLLALRAANHEFRRRADAQLCCHLLLAVSVGPDGTALWHLSTPSGSALPMEPADWRAPCLGGARILSIRMTHSSQRRMGRKDLLLPVLNLPATTVRIEDTFVRMSVTGLAPKAHTLVTHESIGKSFNCDKTGWFFPPHVAGTRIPVWARRCIIVVTYDPEEPELHATTWDKFAVVDDGGDGPFSSPRVVNREESAREVVVILQPTCSNHTARAAQPLQRDLGLLHGLMDDVHLHPSWNWTIVGVKDMRLRAPHAVPILRSDPDHDICAAALQMAGHSNVTMLSLNGYRASIGEKEAAAELD